MPDDRPTDPIGSISPHPGVAFRMAIGLCRFLATVVFGLRLELRGTEHLPRDQHGLPAGGWIGVALPHRRWIDPFMLLLLLPIQPRLVFFGDGRALSRTRFRRVLFRLLGGVVPVWPHGGPTAFWAHIAAARRVLDAGAVFVIFPEAGPPSAPDRARQVQPGLGYLAMRTQARLVPMVIGGTGELYRGRRHVLEVMPTTSAQDLAGLSPEARLPEQNSADERAVAHRIADRFADMVAPPIASLHADVERTSAGDVKRWQWLTHWFDWDADAADAARAARDARKARPGG